MSCGQGLAHHGDAMRGGEDRTPGKFGPEISHSFL